MTPLERQKRQTERDRVAREQRESDLKEVLGSPAGRRLMWDIIDRHAGVFGMSFRFFEGQDTSHLTAHHEGRRAVGVDLMLEAQAAAPQSYELMVLEQIRWQNEVAATLKSEAVPSSGEGRGT